MLYWISTSLLCILLALSAGSYVLHDATIRGVGDLGFPDYFRIQLAVLKLIAIPVLLVPAVPDFMKQWAYAGVALFLLTAMVAHFAHRDPIVINLLNLAALGILAVSMFSLNR